LKVRSVDDTVGISIRTRSGRGRRRAQGSLPREKIGAIHVAVRVIIAWLGIKLEGNKHLANADFRVVYVRNNG